MKTYEFRITYDDDYVEVEAENENEAIAVFFQIDTAKTGSHFHFIKHKVIS